MKKLMLVLFVVLLFVVGCEGVWQAVADPNSGLNQTADAVGELAPAIGAGATATGTPWGTTAGVVCTLLAAAAGVYNNHRKKITIGKKDSDINNIRETTKAIVRAVDEMSDVKTGSGETVGGIVKSEVKAKLTDKDWYKVGRAIIDGLKSVK